MGLKIKMNPNGTIGRKTNGAIALCPAVSEYTVVFPSNDGSTYQRTFTLTESNGIWIGGGEINLMMSNVIFDIAYPTNAPLTPWTYHASISIEMTIDGETGERSVRVVSDNTVTPMFPPFPKAGQSDYTEVFADGSTFNLSASSLTVRPVTYS